MSPVYTHLNLPPQTGEEVGRFLPPKVEEVGGGGPTEGGHTFYGSHFGAVALVANKRISPAPVS